MTFKGHVLNLQIDPNLPFYSQIFLTSSSFHKDKDVSDTFTTNSFLFKSLDPNLTKDDIKNLILSNKELSNYFNTENNYFEITQKGNNLYHSQVENKDVEIPKVLTTNYTPPFYFNKEHILKDELRKQYSKVNVQQLQKMCDEYMSKYDLEKELNKKLRQKVVTDEEGFQLVTSGPLPVKASNLPQTKKKKKNKI